MSSSASLLDLHDAVLLDLDGTVYHGIRPIDGAAAGIEAAHDAGVAVRFVTNNASKAPHQVAAHLRDLGVPARADEVATSAQAGASLLAALVPPETVVLVVGSGALEAEVRAVGLRTARGFTGEIGAVIQGHSRDTGWAELAEACLAIRAGARWVACNADPTVPTERGLLPGNGSMVAALRTATDAVPEVAGKPEPGLFTEAALAAGAGRPLVVGDRLDTDIAGAAAAKMDSLLVFTGVSTPHDVLAAPEGQRPRYLAPDLTSLSAHAASLAMGPRDGWHIDVDGDALRVGGAGDPLDLLRALCDRAWATGHTRVSVADDGAREAVRSLGL